MFKDWGERSPDESAMAEAELSNGAFQSFEDGTLFSVVPPPIEGLGTSGGFALRLQDRGGLGREALLAANEQLMAKVFENPMFAYIMVEGLKDAPQLDVRVDRDKAEALGVSFDAVNAALSTAYGSALVNEFPNQAVCSA